MRITETQLVQILLDNPHVQIACPNPSPLGPPLLLVVRHATQKRHLRLPPQFQNIQPLIEEGDEITDLRTYDIVPHADHPNQRCQDEPVRLGTQIQPKNAPWVGTAGAPVTWVDPKRNRRYGILSNWHVMVDSPVVANHPQHQPTERFPAIAHLSDFTPVEPDQANQTDAAIADAEIDGLHSISLEIIGIGKPSPTTTDATPGLEVTKSGRTTGVTTAECSGVGAAVRVSYGDFTALFTDQDVFTSIGAPFSAAGDSGSLILSATGLRPTALLFAGGGNLTIGNPIRHVVEALNLTFPN